MRHVKRKTVLGIVVSFAFLLGTLVAPVSALQAEIVVAEVNQAFSSGPANHTFLYVEPDPDAFVSRSWIHPDEDLDYTTYRYDSGGWASPDSSVAEDTNPPFQWRSFQGFPDGPFSNPVLLPQFFDFSASDDSEFELNSTIETRTFSLAFGQHTPVLVETGYVYFGTLGISGREFVHLTIACQRDGVSWDIAVIDPEGRFITSYSGANGDIWTIPFHPSVDGTYIVVLQAFPSSGIYSLFELFPEAIAPTPIGAGEVVTGELPTGEIRFNEEHGSWVYEEMPPTVHTYKVSSTSGIGSVIYSFNYPIWLWGPTQPASIMFTNDAFLYDYGGGNRYMDGDSYPSLSTGIYFYDGSTHYITVMGGDDTEYTLYHQAGVGEDLPVNEEFQIENYQGATVHRAYRLNLASDSFVRVNSSFDPADLSIMASANFEDGYRYDDTFSFDVDIVNAPEYFLRAGDYVVVLAIDSGVNDWLEFNVAPISSATDLNFARLAGVSVVTEPWHMYNLSLTLKSHDNVSVYLVINVYDQSGMQHMAAGTTLGTWWDGSSMISHPSLSNNITYMLGGVYYYDGNATVSICAYEVYNNTLGPPGDLYPDYPVEIEVEWVNRMDDVYDAYHDMENSASADALNITLSYEDPGEYHGITLNATVGTWYNVTVRTFNVTSSNFALYTLFDSRTHVTPWGDLNDAYVGDIGNFSFQFGAISATCFLSVYIGLNGDGWYWIEIEPMATHKLVLPEVAEVGPDLLAMLGAIAIPAAIGVAVIVVVYVVYVKKYKTRSL